MKSKTYSTEHRVQSTECWAQSAEYIVRLTDLRLQSAEYRVQSTVYRAQSTEHRALILLVILVVDKMQIKQHRILDELWTERACWFDSWWWNEERKEICNVCAGGKLIESSDC